MTGKIPVRAVLWDFGGVILSSPFEAFARYEAEQNLPQDFIRRLNTTNPHDNAWAKLERSHIDVDAFCTLFEAEARAAGLLIPRHVAPAFRNDAAPLFRELAAP